MSKTFYWETTVGKCLKETLEEISEQTSLPDILKQKAMEKFDEVIIDEFQQMASKVTH